MRAALPFVALIPLIVFACGGEGDGPGTSSTTGTGGGDGGGGLPCDVDAVLGQSCRSCHGASPKFGAPMPLVTHADLHAAAPSDASKKVFELVGTRVHDDADPMPPTPNARLGEADAALLDAWIAKGAPAGTETCNGGGGGGGGGGSTTLGCTPDITLQPSEPWVMPKDVEDTYVCYGVDVPHDSKRHIVGLAPYIDNSTILHHMLLFQADASYPSTPQPCGGASMGRLLAVWAPGGGALELPPEAGFAVEGTSHFVLQVHYSNLMALEGEQDRSGYQLCTTTDLRPNDADIMAFGTTQIYVPAHGSQDVTCDLPIPHYIPSINVIAGMPHMHKIGKAISTTLLPSGSGAPVDLGSADPWDFENQIWSAVNTPIQPGDMVRTRCAWDNPTNDVVGFGEQTNNEMCFGFVMYYPKFEFAWHWILPAVSASCSPTP